MAQVHRQLVQRAGVHTFAMPFQSATIEVERLIWRQVLMDDLAPGVAGPRQLIWKRLLTKMHVPVADVDVSQLLSSLASSFTHQQPVAKATAQPQFREVTKRHKD